MTNLTGTLNEVLHSMLAPGAALSNSTTSTVLSGNSTTNPPFQLPAPLWLPGYSQGRALRVTARGTISTAATPGTLLVLAGLDPTQNSATSRLTLAATGALTPPASLSNGEFALEFDWVFSTVGVSGGSYTSASYTGGRFSLGAGANAATTAAVGYMVGGGSSAISADPATPYFLEIWATWGTASASNSIQLTQFIVQGLN